MAALFTVGMEKSKLKSAITKDVVVDNNFIFSSLILLK